MTIITGSFTNNRVANPPVSTTVVLLPLDGTDGDTTTTDSMGNATITINGSGELDSAQAKFGATSYLCDGAASFSTQPLVDAGMADGDWTVEFWYRPDGTASVNDRIFQTRDGDLVTGIYIAHYEFDASQIGFGYDANGGTPWDYTSGGVTVTDDVWQHIALVRSGSDWDLYLAGTSVLSTTFAGSIYLVGSDTCVIGAQTSGSTRANSGWIDDVRITASAVYTGAFTPPTAALTPYF